MTAPGDAALDRDALRAAARELLQAESGSQQVRALLEDPLGHDPALWSRLGELGWTGIAIPERYGGAGASFAELAVLLVEIGRWLVPSPFAWTTALGAEALLAGESESLREAQLPRLARGEAVATAALTGPSGRCDVGAIELVLRPNGRALRVDGVADFVPDAHLADGLVLAARAPQGGVALLWADAGSPALRIEPHRTWDPTRRLCRIEVRELIVTEEQLLAPPARGAALREHLLDAAAVALACDSAGGAARVLEETVAYAKERVQFDRPIGSFQAVKHRCADMMSAVETSAVAVEHAAEALGDSPQTNLANRGDSPQTNLSTRKVQAARVAASEAKFYACDAYARVAGDGIQLHGGVGFTWEYDCHLFLKRAKLNQALLGDSAWHRDRVAALLLDGAAPLVEA